MTKIIDISNNKVCLLPSKEKSIIIYNKHKINNLNTKRESLIMNIKMLLDEYKKNNENPFNKESIKKKELLLYLDHVNNTYNYIYLNKKKVHQIMLPPQIAPKHVKIKVKLNNLQDLLDLIDKYPIMSNVTYNIDMESLHNIKKPVQNLNNMIGMDKLKSSILDQILYFVQKLHTNKNKDNIDFMHTVIYGPPGTGKTEIANIIGDIFSNLGILKNKIFRQKL